MDELIHIPVPPHDVCALGSPARRREARSVKRYFLSYPARFNQ